MANTAWTNGGRERTTRMTDRWSTKCAQPARASPLYTLELAPVLAQIGLLKLRPLGPLVPHVLQSSFHASVPPRNFHRFDSPRSSSWAGGGWTGTGRCISWNRGSEKVRSGVQVERVEDMEVYSLGFRE